MCVLFSFPPHPPSVLFLQIAFKAEEKLIWKHFQQSAPRALHSAMPSNTALHRAAINTHHRPQPGEFMNLGLSCCRPLVFSPSPSRKTFLCRQLSPKIQDTSKDNTYLCSSLNFWICYNSKEEKKNCQKTHRKTVVFLLLISFSSFCCSNWHGDDSKDSHSRSERQLKKVKNRQICPY